MLLTKTKKTALAIAKKGMCKPCILLLLCSGAHFYDKDDAGGKETELRDILKLFQDRDIFELFQDGNHHHDVTENLYSKEEGRFFWNLTLVLALKHRAVAFKVFYMIR